MRQLVFLNKVTIIIMLVSLLTACSTENNVEQGKDGIEKTLNKYSYSLSFYESSEKCNLNWKNNIKHRIIEVENMSDMSLEDKINDSIRNAIISWTRGYILNATTSHLDIYCHSSNYLSFVNKLEYTDKRTVYIHDYITIDIKTGKRVMLEDIIRIDEEFVEYIQNNNIIKESINHPAYGGDLEILNSYTSDELLDALKECSKTQQEIMKENGDYKEGFFGSLLTRSSFFLKENQLVIVLGYAGGEHHFAYDLEDISEFLKVEMW